MADLQNVTLEEAKTFEDFEALAARFGGDVGKGADGQINLGHTVYNAKQAGAIGKGTEEQTTKEIVALYSAFGKAQMEAGSYVKRVDLSNPDSLSAGASKLNVFAKLADRGKGAWEGTVEVAKTHLDESFDRLLGSRYEQILRCVRNVLKDANTAKATLTTDEVAAILAPKEADADPVEAAMEAARKSFANKAKASKKAADACAKPVTAQGRTFPADPVARALNLSHEVHFTRIASAIEAELATYMASKVAPVEQTIVPAPVAASQPATAKLTKKEARATAMEAAE